MSVPISVVVEDPETLREKITGFELWEVFEEEKLDEEELVHDELDFQLDLLDIYDSFKERLSSKTRNAFEEFVNVIFWSWREDDGRNRMDVDLELDELDSSFSPDSCRELLGYFDAIDWEELENNYIPDDFVTSFADYRRYFDDWKTILEKARASGKTVFVFGLG